MDVTERAERAVVGFLAADLTRAHRAVAWHHADERGCCAVCGMGVRSVRHPCLIHLLAAEAIHRSIPLPREPT